MEYEKVYFPKSEMSHIVPTTDAYAEYAASFDLSLLPTDCDLPLSPQSDFSSAHSPQVSLDYIPTTIFHDQLPPHQSIKTEKIWNDEIPSITSTSSPLPPPQNLLEQYHNQYQIYPSPLPSPPQEQNQVTSTVHLYPPSSPCPPVPIVDKTPPNQTIKQEFHILPPSPPESSCGVPSPHSFADIKNEPESDVEALIDINSLLESSLTNLEKSESESKRSAAQDHQLLREYLEDTTFQKKHNLKPLALESLIGGLGIRGIIEPVISLALEHAKRDAEETCAKLQISADPQQWTSGQVHAWLRSTIDQFKLPQIDDLELKFPEDGSTLSLLTEEQFMQRAPEIGGTIHAQLEIWKLACSENFHADMSSMATTSNNNWNSECSPNLMDITDDEDDEMLPVPTSTTTSLNPAGPAASVKPPTARTGGSHIHLWQFLKELLATPQVNGTAIRWLDRNKGVFKIEDSVRVAKLWGRRKNRPAMNYDKLSRSIRQYYKKGIMKKTERSQRLVYQFCHPYSL